MDRVTILVRHDDTEPDSSVAERQIELVGDVKYLKRLTSSSQALGTTVVNMIIDLLENATECNS